MIPYPVLLAANEVAGILILFASYGIPRVSPLIQRPARVAPHQHPF
jgi:hypothetical protein